MWNQDTTGVVRSKPSPPLATIDYHIYEKAVNWFRSQLLPFGYEAVKVSLDPYLEHWNFYDAQGNILIRVPHSLLERAHFALHGIS